MPRGVGVAVSVVALLAVGCSRGPKAPPPPPAPAVCGPQAVTVEAIDVERDGVTSFRVVGEGCSLTRPVGVRAVLDRLLFVGVPQSTQTLPMLDQPDVYRTQPPKELRQLRDDAWAQFVVSVMPLDTGAYTVRYDLSGLRRWLERNRLARKFGLP